MRLYACLTLLTWLLVACSSTTKTPSSSSGIDDLLEPKAGEIYRSYSNFEDLAALFNQQNDTIYVLNFWATWCKPCLEELPHFEQLAQAYAAEPLKVVLIALDELPNTQEKLLQFAQQRGLALPIISLQDPDKKSWQAKVDKRWDGSIPATLIYRKQSRFFANKAFSTYFDLEQLVKPLMRSK